MTKKYRQHKACKYFFRYSTVKHPTDTEERTGRKSEKECENRRRDEYRILDGTWDDCVRRMRNPWQEEILQRLVRIYEISNHLELR